MSHLLAKTLEEGLFIRTAACFLVVSCIVLANGAGYAQAPHQIAGFTLGNDINQYKDILRMDTALPLRHMEYLSEVEMKPFEGYKSGYVFYGNCDAPGRIVKVKLKFEREDKEFFEQLLELYKKKFGKTCEYKGDPFRAFIVWKWSLTDDKNNTISLMLQHNSVDEEEYTSGNSVKMSFTNLIEKERQCYEKKHPEDVEPQKAPSREKGKGKIDVKMFVPE